METTSPFLQPGFLLPVIIAVIGFIAWLIRLESKVNGTEKGQMRLEQAVEDTWKDIEQHRTNGEIHFSQRLATEVAQRQTDRFVRIETDLKEIKDLVKGIAGK